MILELFQRCGIFSILIQNNDKTLYILFSDFDIHITSLNASFDKQLLVDASSEIDIRIWIQIDEVQSENSVLQFDMEGANPIKMYLKDGYSHLEHDRFAFNYH